MRVCTPTPPPAYVWTLSLSLFWPFLSDDLPEASTSTLSMHLAQVISKRPGTATTLHHTKSVSWMPGAKPKLQTISFISRLVFIGVRPNVFDQIMTMKMKMTNASSLENCFMWLLLWLKTIVFLAIKVVQESLWEDGMITETLFSLYICYCKDRMVKRYLRESALPLTLSTIHLKMCHKKNFFRSKIM